MRRREQLVLRAGICRELCDLVRIDGVDGVRARALHKAGFTSVGKLASALTNTEDVVGRQKVAAALRRAMPYEVVDGARHWFDFIYDFIIGHFLVAVRRTCCANGCTCIRP